MNSQATLKLDLARAREAMSAGQWTEADLALRALLARDPQNAMTLRLLATVVRQLGRTNLAIELGKLALTYDNSADGHFELACSLHRTDRVDEALQHFAKAQQQRPEWADPVLNSGALLDRLDRCDEALAQLQLAVELDPACPIARYNLGNVLQKLGRIEDAARSYEAALERNPNFAKAHWNLALCRLSQGNFAQGWEEFRWRAKAQEVLHDLYPQPRAIERAQLVGKSVLVHGEQGIGDEIMFAGCIDDLRQLAKGVTLICEPRLQPLFARQWPDLCVIGYARRKNRRPFDVAGIDVQLPAGDVPRLFRNEFSDFPQRKNYLTADSQMIDAWKLRLALLGTGLRIGISWRAGGQPLERRRRSTTLPDWLPLLQTSGIEWINLQYGETDRERDELQQQHGIAIHDWPAGDPLCDLDEFAARVAALDMVISVGNTTVHLAGALGIPTLVVLPTIPGWRWQLQGDRNPWYSSVRCFRQQRDELWPSVLARVAEELNVDRGVRKSQAKQYSFQNPVTPMTNKPTEQNKSLISGRFDVMENLRQIQRLIERREWSAAEKICDEVLIHAPRKPEAWYSLAQIMRATQRAELAIKSLQRAILLGENSTDWRLELAETRLMFGQFDAAKQDFSDLAAALPERADVWLGLGLCHRALNDFDSALDALTRVERLSPNNPKAHNIRGAILMEQQAPAAAITAFERAVELAPNYAAAWNNLGCILHAQNHAGRAAECFAKIVQLEPQNESAANALRECLKTAESKPQAAAETQVPIAPPQKLDTPKKEAPKTAPTWSQATLDQAAALFNKEQYEDASKLAREILVADPDHAIALRILGVGQRRKQEFELAIITLKHAIAIAPQNFALHFELGVCYLEQHHHQPAYECFARSLDCKPDFHPGYINLSGIMEQQERYEDATTWAQRAVQIAGNSCIAYYNLGNSLREQGLIEEAIRAYETSLQHDPAYARASWNLGICHLHLGNYSQGWQGYELRGTVGEVEFDDYPQPRWQGESLTGKTILIHGEQGLGDEIVFCSCIPELIAQAGRVIIVCEMRLEKLFQRSFPQATVKGYMRRKDKKPCEVSGEVDYQLPMGSLPLYFRGTREAFPRQEKFLVPDPVLVAQWREKFAALGNGLKVGVSWRAGGKPLERRKRSIPTELWEPIFTKEGAQFINLQYGDASEDAEEVHDRFGITLHDWEQGDPLIDIDNFAAKIAALDLVISVGNATVHLAGAIGTPAWTLLPMIPSWRWMIRGAESPWYKHVRLFRQPTRKDWAPVLKNLGLMLGKLLTAPRAQWHSLAGKMPAPPLSAPPHREKPLAEHVWLDHTQFSALATLEQIPVTMERAKQAADTGDYDLAETLLGSVLQIAPKFPTALHQLGLVALKQGRPSLAIRSLQRALSTAEAVPLRRCDLALAFAAAERHDEAIASYRRALELNPQFNRAHQELGELLWKLNRHAEARPHFQAAGLSLPGELVKSAASATTSAGVPDRISKAEDAQLSTIRQLVQARQIDAARSAAEKLLSKFPDCTEAMILLAELLHEDQEEAAAAEYLEAAIDIEPSAQAYLLLGRVLEAQGHDTEALATFQLAFALDEHLAPAQIHAANLALKLNQAALAEQYYRAALQLVPNNRELWNALGLSLFEQGHLAAAIDCYQQALKISAPQTYPTAQANLAFALLQQGEYAEGWQAYEARWNCAESTPRRSQLPMPEWDCGSLTGKSLLIHAEQGLGDEIMFASCYQELCGEAKRIVATCDPRMKALFQRSFPQIEWIALTRGQEFRWQPLPAQRCDLHIAAGSILQYRRRSLQDYPQQPSFLTAEPALLAEWQSRFAALPAGARIGIAWQGGELAKDRQRRCLNIEQLSTLLNVQGVQWVNLQHGDLNGVDTRIHDWPEFDLRDDLENLAARIAACDLVISVGNAAVHLAGALGVPTWCLLPAAGAWRWGPAGQSTPWYASVRPLRQTVTGDWRPLLQSLTEVLPKWIAAQANSKAADSRGTSQAAFSNSPARSLTMSPKPPLAPPHWQTMPAAKKHDLLR
jgi:tetratricopeptide (TPR) repeat protein/ADP-heptose:LPS heptosyltransferase